MLTTIGTLFDGTNLLQNTNKDNIYDLLKEVYDVPAKTDKKWVKNEIPKFICHRTYFLEATLENQVVKFVVITGHVNKDDCHIYTTNNGVVKDKKVKKEELYDVFSRFLPLSTLSQYFHLPEEEVTKDKKELVYYVSNYAAPNMGIAEELLKYKKSKSVSKPMVKPASRPIAKPVVKPASRPVAKPVIKAVSRPVAKPVPIILSSIKKENDANKVNMKVCGSTSEDEMEKWDDTMSQDE
ncbi:Hypothetical protein ORPV_831 [Orpheovirus IHUMI-LCC2]|uniref:Uncharacterized protein n=1 Tax=Orpheovirus IHUMI-LCC2 TaxID=2023057 RepID=A0A2I2L5A3_9VIRU|nr:Hypothetical protein ORPV_831 [Orpheovirus IHUMI-LCC2]SNW62735.1 Hypothetical protein ORPV_831 [Orpheovirus IHUMI-LCC2]